MLLELEADGLQQKNLSIEREYTIDSVEGKLESLFQ